MKKNGGERPTVGHRRESPENKHHANIVDLAERRREKRQATLERIYQFEEELAQREGAALPRLSDDEILETVSGVWDESDRMRRHREISQALSGIVQVAQEMTDFMRELAGVSAEEYAAYCRDREGE